MPPALLALALAVLVLALARPQATVAVPVERASVVLVTDTSGSMEATDVAPTRLAAAQAAAERFLDRVPDALQVGLVGYADAAHTVLAPTQDRAEVRTALEGLVADGGTATGNALASALQTLGRRGKDQPARRGGAPVGRRHDGRAAIRSPSRARPGRRTCRSSPWRSARPTGSSRRRTAGSWRSRRIPRRCARSPRLSGGRAFTAEDANALDSVYERLGSQIGTRRVRREVSAGFAAAGLLLLAGALATSLRWRGRLP